MKAVIVSVDYTDLLRLTLNYNRHHFSSVTVVTSPADAPNVIPVAEANDARVYATDAFYRNGAKFNKWLALEEGLDFAGRDGWICLLDADILWPRVVDLERYLKPGYLYCPFRRMVDPVPTPIPPEEEWKKYPVHRQERELAGYSQIFHASDPVLGTPPWHDVSWRHAGGADSFLQAKWPEDRKVRPPFRVLHLGPPGVNWCGRASRYLDGGEHPEAKERKAELRDMILKRRGAANFDHEKLKGG